MSIDEKPMLDVQIDNSTFNNLQISLKLGVDYKSNIRLNEAMVKPLKLSIMYTENSTFSKMESSSFNSYLNDRIWIAPGLLTRQSKTCKFYG